MKANKVFAAIEPRKMKAVAAAVIAFIGVTLAIVAYGITTDHTTFAQQVVQAMSHGPVADVVHSLYIK